MVELFEQRQQVYGNFFGQGVVEEQLQNLVDHQLVVVGEQLLVLLQMQIGVEPAALLERCGAEFVVAEDRGDLGRGR